jgi:hypothetical protein
MGIMKRMDNVKLIVEITVQNVLNHLNVIFVLKDITLINRILAK